MSQGSLFRPGFVRAVGTELVDDAGPLALRGVGLGNWMLPEGYMWCFGDDLASPRQIEARIEALVGADRAAQFWKVFRERFISEADFALIAQSGFDHVRLPINARVVMDDEGAWLEDGWALIEQAVRWSEAHGLRILFDLHGAPGGQTGTNIDDSPRGKPELFMDDAYRALTVHLWCELATRYRDRTAVLGYDLLNEPLPDEWQHRYEDELVSLYRELTAVVREVDENHLLMYEGSHWATNWSPLRARFDDNQALQFHRYWCAPDETSIAEYLEMRDALQTPIYMGEGGENTAGWIYAATQLYERHGIGWNFWPWKKLSTRTSPLSVRTPERWHLIADPAQHPNPDEAWTVLEEYLDSIPAERCEVRGDVLDALFARPGFVLPAWAGVLDGVASTVDDLVNGDVPEGLWHHTSGEPYLPNEQVSVWVSTGSSLAFALAEEPSSWELQANRPDQITVTWTGTDLLLEAVNPVLLRSVSVNRGCSVEI